MRDENISEIGNLYPKLIVLILMMYEGTNQVRDTVNMRATTDKIKAIVLHGQPNHNFQ